MAVAGWHKLIPSEPLFLGEGRFRLDAYSEFLPAPWVGWKPYGGQPVDPDLFSPNDPWGWRVSEFEEMLELRPGLVQTGKQIMNKLSRLLDGDPDTGLPKLALASNPFWPPELACEPNCPQEKCVVLLPIALSRTQDDKGRVRWTLFGNSEQGPGKAFWRSFFTAPKKEAPAEQGIAFFCKLLNAAYGTKLEGAGGLRHAGFRIMRDEEPAFEFWDEGPLPSWTEPFLLTDRQAVGNVKYLLTFRPFGKLPAAVRKAYLAGNLCLLPFPGSLTAWGVMMYRELHRELPLALQLPFLLNIARHRMPDGIRVPQSGYLHEPTADHPHPHGVHAGQVRNTFKRTHRWDKILRDQDELALIGKEDKMLHVLFSTIPEDISLYDKPMARNIQLWTEDSRLVLDGPNATPEQLKQAMRTVQAGGMFGYRFVFPAMRVGMHEVYWHRPLVAFRDAKREPVVMTDAPLGYLTAYDLKRPRLDRPLEFWPRILHRPLPSAAVAMLKNGPGSTGTGIVRNVRKLFDSFKLFGRPLPRSIARQLLSVHRGESLESWLACVPPSVAEEVHGLVETEPMPLPLNKRSHVPESLTYRRSANRLFEVTYWKTISALSEGTLLNKNNADCVGDEITKRLLPYHERQLENLGDYLLAYYNRKIAAARMVGRALAGEVPFRWRTDFDYSWMGGWLKNQEAAAERDLLIMIPGRDRKRAVIMADHYDTAYMADKYDKQYGGCGARLAACGADDNHSATAAMMLAAPIFLEMSKKGLLDCDIWLVHLTGEEFPADCLGARALTQRLIEGTLKLHMPGGKTRDLSKTIVQGLYVSDMIAHNNDRERDVFQISPGVDAPAMQLAYHAHVANEIWNASVPEWNKHPDRAGRPPGRRSPHGGAIPEIAPFLTLSGQVRPASDPRSTLYNTDGQIFSDAGVPCVLFMENYDINRVGYHDTHDTMENIDLDYGAALCAITIESVARAASTPAT
jgi:Peptidase family M28